MLDMEKAEKVKKALRVCLAPGFCKGKGCPYEGECGAGETLDADALEVIEEMEKALKMFVPLEAKNEQ